MNTAHLNAAFRRWCWSHSQAVFHQDGRLGVLRRLLAEIPTHFC